MAAITVTHLSEDRFQIATRGHTVLVDQPHADGGEVGPTPVELLVMSLASCVAHYAVGYLRRQDIPQEDLRVECRWTMRPDPARVGRVELTVAPSVPLTDDQHAGLLAAVESCTVHNSLLLPPAVRITASIVEHAEN